VSSQVRTLVLWVVLMFLFVGFSKVGQTTGDVAGNLD